MLPGFDPQRAGKAFHELNPLIGTLDGIKSEYLCCIKNGTGPSVLLCGGIHGDEYEAQIVLRRLAERLEPADVTGRVIIIPSLNFPAAQKGQRLSPFDGQNMNRFFPGKEDGTPTERLCAFIAATLFPIADLLIDVHAGGSDVTVVPMVFGFTTERSVVSEDELERLMEAWGYRFVQHVDGIEETACGAAKLVDLASIEVEGGGGRMSSTELVIMEQGLLRALAAFNVIKPVVDPIAFSGIHIKSELKGQYLAPSDGLIEHLVSLGDNVEMGAPVAKLHPIAGKASDIQVIRSPCAGYVLRQREHAFVCADQLVGNIGWQRD